MRNRRIIYADAIRHNMEAIRAAVPKSAKIMAVVKADGYGHGAVTAARAALESELGGNSLASLMQRYEAARDELAAAEQQLAEGKQALDEGYAQAAAAEQQLAEGKQPLDE